MGKAASFWISFAHKFYLAWRRPTRRSVRDDGNFSLCISLGSIGIGISKTIKSHHVGLREPHQPVREPDVKQKSSEKILDQTLEIPVIPIIKSIFPPSLFLPAFLGEVVVWVVVGWDGSDSSKSWPWKIRAQTLADHNSAHLLCTMPLCSADKKNLQVEFTELVAWTERSFWGVGGLFTKLCDAGTKKTPDLPNTKTHDRMASHGI